MRRIRSEPGFDQLPLIVFSNTYLTSMVEQAWKAGATKCLSKSSCTPKQVIEAVRSTLPNNGGGPAGVHTAAGAALSQRPGRPGLDHVPATAQDHLTTGDADSEFQTELRRSFMESLPGIMGALRSLLQGLIKADTEVARLKQVHEIYRRIHALTGNSGLAGMMQIAQMSDALEALLKELYEKPKNINASPLRTIASAIDFIVTLYERVILPQNQ